MQSQKRSLNLASAAAAPAPKKIKGLGAASGGAGLAAVPRGDWYSNSHKRQKSRAKGANAKKDKGEGGYISFHKPRAGGRPPVAVEQYDLNTDETIETYPSKRDDGG